jgi:cytochrome c peroxidase
MKISRAALALVLLSACGKAETAATTGMTPAKLRIPELGPVPALPEWADDPTTPEKSELGRYIFFDARLSGSGHTTCDACHGHQVFFQDNLPAATPDRSYPSDTPKLHRNTLSFYNIVYAPVFRWDGSHTDLVDVMVFPFSEANMNLGADVPSAQLGLQKRLTVDVPAYVPLFQTAFGEDLGKLDAPAVWRLAGRALRAFVRKAVSRDSAFDKWNAGDDAAMSDSAVRGIALFQGKGRCIVCHAGPFLTDFSFHNLSTSPPDAGGARADEGRYLITMKEEDRGKFLTPTLRQSYMTGPYFHDGSAASLRNVLAHLNGAMVTADPNHDAAFDAPLGLGAADIDDLVELMGAMRGTDAVDYSIVPPPAGTP